MTAVIQEHPGDHVQLWFMDEARVGQKGRNAHVWYERGKRPTVLTDKRFQWAYIFAAARPGTDDAFALVMPQVSTEAMAVFLHAFAANLPKNVHAALVLERAGWHVAGRLTVPANISLIHRLPYLPELNPVERIWLYMRERWLGHRLFTDAEAIIEGCCQAWTYLTAEPGRLSTLTGYPYLQKGNIK